MLMLKFLGKSVNLVCFLEAMDEETPNSSRRMSMRTRKVAPKMAAALANSDNRTQVWRYCYFMLISCGIDLELCIMWI